MGPHVHEYTNPGSACKLLYTTCSTMPHDVSGRRGRFWQCL